MMFFFSVLIGLLLMLTAEAMVGDSSKLDFCTETEQSLLFDTVCKTHGYEVRHYQSVKWVSTDEPSFIMEFAAMTAFRRLFEYIGGSNDKGVEIEMTSPVVIIIPHKYWWQRSVYTMSFPLPAEYQENPPQPTDNKVYIYETPDMHMYVRSYGGWMTSTCDKDAIDKLTYNLDEVGAKYGADEHFAAVYNSPMTMKKKHNEVMVVVEGNPVCPMSTTEQPDDLSTFW